MDDQHIAQQAREGAAQERVSALWERDPAVRGLGIRLEAADGERLRLAWEPPPGLANGHGILHGGYTFVFADTALAYLCASLGGSAVTRSAEIVFLAPARAGTPLVADAELRTRRGSSAICDVRVTDADGTVVAEFRGQAKLLENI